MRRQLLELWEFHGAPKLDHIVPHYPKVRPRNVTATQAEVAAILSAARPSLRLWLLFCSDLAMRSGTAAKISGHHFDPDTNTIAFRTKGHVGQRLPLTEEIYALIAPLDHQSSKPYVWQLRDQENSGKRARPSTVYTDNSLRVELRQIRQRLQITKRIIPHDLRRTTARNLLHATRDLTKVRDLLGHAELSTTFWYMEQDLAPVNIIELEAIKRPYLVTQGKERTA
ncbi:MAG: tyrosine-type recombinase/integrase [Terracidiphilus sp.]|nr:tyrosine-type recombinase/integrase [Terracidiphilus sp.]